MTENTTQNKSHRGKTRLEKGDINISDMRKFFHSLEGEAVVFDLTIPVKKGGNANHCRNLDQTDLQGISGTNFKTAVHMNIT
jgi:hypothetical protein